MTELLDAFKSKYSDGVVDVGIVAVHYTEEARNIGIHVRYDRNEKDEKIMIAKALETLGNQIDAIKSI